MPTRLYKHSGVVILTPADPGASVYKGSFTAILKPKNPKSSVFKSTVTLILTPNTGVKRRRQIYSAYI